MDGRVRHYIRLAKAQGWRVERGTKHIKFFDARGVYRHGCSPKIPEGNYRLQRNLEADLRRAGLDLDYFNKRKEKTSMPSVADLIKANGQGEPIINSPPPSPPKPTTKTRMSRKGLDEEILKILRAHHPKEVDFTTLKMKASLNQPGVTQPTMHNRLAGLKAAGKVINTRMGYWRAADNVAPTAPPVPRVTAPTGDGLPKDYQTVIDNLVNAVADAERLLRDLHSKTQAAEKLKKLIGEL